MKRIIVSGTENEYIVDSEAFIIAEGGVFFYIFIVHHDDGSMSTLQVPTMAVVEAHDEYSEARIDKLRTMCAAAQQQNTDAKKAAMVPAHDGAGVYG